MKWVNELGLRRRSQKQERGFKPEQVLKQAKSELCQELHTEERVYTPLNGPHCLGPGRRGGRLQCPSNPL